MRSNKRTRFTDMEKFLKILRNEGLKATPQRIAVHEAMMALGHASADSVQEYINAKGETEITVASVYNILESMEALGVYSYRMSANNKKYFDVNAYTHVHLYNNVSHEYKDLADEELVKMVENYFKGRRFKGYKIDSIDIQVVVRPRRKAS